MKALKFFEKYLEHSRAVVGKKDRAIKNELACIYLAKFFQAKRGA